MSGAENVSPLWFPPLVVQAKEGAVLKSDCLGFDWFLSSFSTIGLACSIVLLIIKHLVSYLYLKKSIR